ncbi:flagellar hook-length control protein FliK, partial [Roseicyclus sp.]|uniref:flagellar hook-length control protein FliK n=1 Tax=Roseicyclus sp. TaxID=1914329 RepID=UPI003F9FD690
SAPGVAEAFAGLVGLARASGVAPEAVGTATLRPMARPGIGGDPAAQTELLTDIVALAFAAQEAFLNAGDPAAQAAVLQGFAQALGQRLAAFDASAGGRTLQILAASIGETGAAITGGHPTEAGPLGMARAVLGLLGLGEQAAVLLPDAALPAGEAPAAPRPTPAASPAPPAESAATRPGAALPPQPAASPAPLDVAEGATAPPATDPSALQAGAKPAALGAKPANATLSRPSELPFETMLRTVVQAGEAASTTPRGLVETRVPIAGDAAPQPGGAGAAGTAQAAAPGFARNLVGQVRATPLAEGTTRIELRPRGLGDIEIDMRHDEAGKLRIILKAENPVVLSALRNDRDMLIGALREGGAAVEDADLSFESFGGHQSRQQPERDQWRPALLRDAAEGAEAAISPWTRAPTRPDAPPLAGLDIIT